MKKKVVAAALICSVFGSSHATDNKKFDDYGGTYQGEVHRPVQRLDRFRRYGNRAMPQVENRFSNRNQEKKNYVVNDQTGEKVFLNNTKPPVNRNVAQQFESRTNNKPNRQFESMHHPKQMQRVQNVSNNYESSRFEMDHSRSNNQKRASHYDFVDASNSTMERQHRRPQGYEQGRFAAANSHRNKLDQVQSRQPQSWSQGSNRNDGWSDSNRPESKEQNWQNSHQENSSRRALNDVDSNQNRNWNVVEESVRPTKKKFNQNVNQYKSSKSENYAMDRRSFWPTRDQQTRHVVQENESIHHRTDDLPRADRRIQSRFERPGELASDQRGVIGKPIVHSGGEQLQRNNESQYQSLRRPRVRVDLRNNQSDRRKRQRRSWLPNPFRGVSRMFSGIFGRR